MNFEIAEKIKDNIINKEWSHQPVIQYKKINPNISNFLLEEKLSGEKLDRLINKHINLPFAKDAGENNQNRWKYDRNYPEVTELLEQFNEIYNSDYRCSGIFWLPPSGYCGWHTNSTNADKRMYLVWVEEDNKSFFRYRDVDTDKVVTVWDKSGWNINQFKIPKDKHFWHCVGSNTNRISIGLKYK